MLKDLISALILLLIALGYYVLTGDINPSALADEIGAAGVPVIYATLLAMIALSLAANALIEWRFTRAAPNQPINDLQGEGLKLFYAAGMLAIGIVYVAAVTFLGYLISIAGVIACVALYQGERVGWRLARIAIGGGITFWIFFDRLLGVDMPPGFWRGLVGG
jgi:hypothetical protein